MKTIIKTTKTSLLLLTAIFLAISCSKDDGLGPQPGETQLVLTASSTTVDEGGEITFEVTANGEPVDDAQILVDGTAISGYSHIFNYTGNYEVIAQKEGFSESEPLTIEVLEVQTDVYVAGYENNGTKYVAKYWKNGTAVNLTNGTNDAQANSIFVLAGEIYVAGYEENSSNIKVAKYWKNGVPISLTDGTYTAEANSLFVSDGDVYVAGIEKNASNIKVAKYWINDVPVNLTNGTQFAAANSIFVYNGDVYVAGGEFNGTDFVAKYWKNGTETVPTDGTNASASSIFVSNEDVYMAGGGENTSGDEFAKYWKNGMVVNLNDGLNDADANSIFVYNGEAYIAGHEYSGVKTVAKYWHLPAGGAGNGVPVSLTDGAHDAVAYSIFVSNGDAYVAGYEDNGNHNVAKYWNLPAGEAGNGTPVNLTDGTHRAQAASIFVVRTLVE